MAILLIDKPKGISSYDVIRILQRRCREQGIVRIKEGKMKPQAPKMGHSGTLDPLASGLMLIATDKDTKQLSTLLGLPKTYVADIMLGKKTVSGDLEHEAHEAHSAAHISDDQIAQVLADFQGDIELPVPVYSAIKKDGKSLYKYARNGKDVEVPTKVMHVIHARLIAINRSDADHPIVQIEFAVKSGTYIRSLAEEFALRLGTVGVLSDLRRISIGEYTVQNAASPETYNVELCRS